MRREHAVPEIARQLNLSSPTIYGYLQKAQDILGARDVYEALKKLEQRLSEKN